MYLSSFAPQSYSFGVGGAAGNGFGVGVRSVVGGEGGGGGSSEILQAVQMDQSPFYASRGFGVGGGRSGNGGFRGGGRMLTQRRGGWRRGQQRQGKLSSSYWPFSAVGGRRGYMLLHARLNRADNIFCRWWRRNLLVKAYSIGGRGGGEKRSWCKLLGIVINRG